MYSQTQKEVNDRYWQQYKNKLNSIFKYIKKNKYVSKRDIVNFKMLFDVAIYVCDNKMLPRNISYNLLAHQFIDANDFMNLYITFEKIEQKISDFYDDFFSNLKFSNSERKIMQKALAEIYRYIVRNIIVCSNFEQDTKEKYNTKYKYMFEREY